jgi:hypothetical protein
MFPNNPQNHHPSEPASLPAVPVTSQQQPTGAVPSQPAVPSPMPVGDATARSVAQAKQLALQYANDPYLFSEALSQLKTTYLADQYHIVPSQADH